MESHRFHPHHDALLRATLIALALATATLPAHAATQRLLLTADDEPPAAARFKGPAELAVQPPFEGARISIEIDGQSVGRALASPWTVPVDFGPVAVEHRITVTATSADGRRRREWTRVINAGLRPLSVTLKPVDPAAGVFEAVTTAAENDPVVAVDFYDGTGLLKSLHEAPYRVQLAPQQASGVIRVTARSQSGAEVTDFFAGGSQVAGASYDLRTMNLFVSVVDRNGQTRSDVPAGKFEVLDNGASTRILDVGPAGEQPISVAVLLDASNSMDPYMQQAASAALEFLRSVVRPTDRCSIYSIRSSPRRELPLTQSLDEAEKSLGGIRAGGDTALYDAIAGAIRELSGEKYRRAIVVLSDGEDTASYESFDDLRDLVARSGIPIYFIAFSDGADAGVPAAARRDNDRMNFLAAQTGGFVVSASSDNLRARYHAIERALREQYAIRYQVTDLARPNEWRRIQVVVKSPELSARTISGYFAP